MSAYQITCNECGRDKVFTAADARSFDCGTGIVSSERLDFETCEFCGGNFDRERCYRAHDCPGHDAEIIICVCCSAEIGINLKERHETRPALIDGEPVCSKCAYLKPWESKDPGTSSLSQGGTRS